ncbi:Phage head-tail joining protein [Labrenzia sp. THAF82]|uniref:phage head closure protein n=1 Tax=Labrenzia sp. THAF82 TaxID=2587861 RepID=UPI00126892A3|nr:phage head closure protein [Labrenzia sp. THAF82]QFT31811.1 Phage head-tail joining protein [Labrenzia sp. THAF82]
MRIARRNERVTFQVAAEVSDGGGGFDVTWGGDVTVWGAFFPEFGREKVQGGRIEAPVGGTLNVRYSSDVIGFASDARVLIDGEPYNIRSVTNPDQRKKDLEFVVERGVAT